MNENYKLYQGDCLKIIGKINPKGIAVITDPPYGIDYQSGFGSKSWGNGKIKNDTSTDDRDHIVSWIHKNNLSGLVFGTWKSRKPYKTKMVLIWDTLGALGMGDLKLPWKPSHQEIYVLGNSNGFVGKRTTDILRCPPVQSMAKNGRLHPMQKPVELIVQLILKVKAEIILDPFMGVGTTGVACALLGRKFIGIELDPDYFAIAEKRIKAAYAQEIMF